MCERATTSVPATLCKRRGVLRKRRGVLRKRRGVLRKRRGVLRHTSVAATTALPIGVLSLYLRKFPGNWRLAPILISGKHV